MIKNLLLSQNLLVSSILFRFQEIYPTHENEEGKL